LTIATGGKKYEKKALQNGPHMAGLKAPNAKVVASKKPAEFAPTGYGARKSTLAVQPVQNGNRPGPCGGAA
jgi:hypothetical protein